MDGGLSAARVAEAAAFATALLQAMPAQPQKGVPVHYKKDFATRVVFAVYRLLGTFRAQKEDLTAGNSWLHAFAKDLHAVATSSTSSTASKLHAFYEARARAGTAPQIWAASPLHTLFAEPGALLGVVLSVIFAALNRTRVCGVAVPSVQTWRRFPKVWPAKARGVPGGWHADSGIMTDTDVLGLLLKAGFVQTVIESLARFSRAVFASATVHTATADALLMAATAAVAQLESNPACIPLADAEPWECRRDATQLLCVLSVWHPDAKTPWAWLAGVGQLATFNTQFVLRVSSLLASAQTVPGARVCAGPMLLRYPPRTLVTLNSAAVDLLFKWSSVGGLPLLPETGAACSVVRSALRNMYHGPRYAYVSDGTAVHGDGVLRTVVRRAVVLLGGAVTDKDEPTSSKRHHGDGAHGCARAVLAFMAANAHVFVTPEDTWTELLEGLCGCL